MKHIHRTRMGLVLPACLLLACAGTTTTTTVPADPVDAASAIAAAEAAGAEEEAQASLHLKLARDQLSDAKELMNDDESEEARLLLQRAKADAELALMIVRQSQAEDNAQRARQQVQGLHRED